MKNIKLSIIVTAHNMQDKVPACMESITKSLGNESDFELIAINDSSTDKTGEILEGICSKIENSHYYITNFKNIGKVRNFALSKCSGEFITMVDGDDLLYPNALSAIIELIKNRDFDILLSPLHEVWNEKPTIESYNINRLTSFSQKTAIREFLIHKKFQGHFIGKVIKRELFIKNPIPNYPCYEDFAFIPTLLVKSSRILYCENPYYLYVKDSQSLSNKITNEKVQLNALAIIDIDRVLGGKWRYLVACHAVKLLNKYPKQLSPENLNKINNLLKETPVLKFFFSPSVRMSFKKKYLTLLLKK